MRRPRPVKGSAVEASGTAARGPVVGVVRVPTRGLGELR